MQNPHVEEINVLSVIQNECAVPDTIYNRQLQALFSLSGTVPRLACSSRQTRLATPSPASGFQLFLAPTTHFSFFTPRSKNRIRSLQTERRHLALSNPLLWEKVPGHLSQPFSGGWAEQAEKRRHKSNLRGLSPLLPLLYPSPSLCPSTVRTPLSHLSALVGVRFLEATWTMI